MGAMPATMLDPSAPISGHIYLREGKRRSVWYAKWRDQQGQHQQRLGPAWTSKGAPPPGQLRRRDAQAQLEEILVEARRGRLRQERTGLTFADIAEDWYERGPLERDWSASTQADYRSVLNAHLLPEFGQRRIETITAQQIEQWRSRLAKDGKRARKTVNKIVMQAHAIFQHAVEHFGLIVNVVAKVKRLRQSYDAARYDFYSPEEIDLIVATAAKGAHRDPSRPAVSDTERTLRAEEDQPGGGALPHCSPRGSTSQRTPGPPLGGRRLRAVLHPGMGSLQRQTEGQAEVAQIPHGADGGQGRSRAEGTQEAKPSHRQERSRLLQSRWHSP